MKRGLYGNIKIRMKRYIYILLLILTASYINANDNDYVIQKANEAYSQGKYDTAIVYYEDIIAKSYEASELFYNLGNAYFKINNIPAAILYYEKGKKLNPNDEDIEFNLKVANSKIVDKIEVVPELFLLRWWRNIINMLSEKHWAIISIICFLLMFVFLTFYLVSKAVSVRKATFLLSIMMLLITIFSIFSAFNHLKKLKNENTAIVFTPTVTVKSSPNQNSVDLFVIHEGTKVKITDIVGDWYEIKIANGSIGWLEVSNVRKI